MNPRALWVKVVIVLVLVAFVGTGLAAFTLGGADKSVPKLPEFGALTYVEPFDNTGSKAAIADVKRVLPQLLTDEVAVQRLPGTLAARKLAIESAEGKAARREAIDKVWVADKRESLTTELEKALVEVGLDPKYQSFDDNRFVVTDWQSVGVEGNSATVLVIGHQEYRLGSEQWQADRDDQYQVLLGHHEGGRWALSIVQRAQLPGVPQG